MATGMDSYCLGKWRALAPKSQLWLTIIGLVFLIAWGVWWTKSVRKNHLVGAERTWVPAWQFLGLDFLNNYYASRHWLAGGDAYRQPFGDPIQRRFCYPPIVLILFAWCGSCSPRTAVKLWTVALVLLAAIGVWAAWRSRQKLGLWNVPLPFALAGMLFSAPFLFALERGNYDILVVLPLLLAAWALGKRSVCRDVVAGVCLAVAAGMKVYPAFLLLGLLPLRRLRAFACCAGVGVLLGLYHFQDLPQFWANVQDLIAHESPLARGVIDPRVHTLSNCWPLLWREGRWATLAPLTRIPGTLAALTFILPLALLVSYQIYRCPDPKRLLYPHFLWLTAAATFIPQISNDYNLVFLPLAVIAVWDKRDPVLVHICMAFMLLWAQPIMLPIGPKLLLVFKCLTLAAVALSLIYRAREQAQIGHGSETQTFAVPKPLPAAA